MGLYETIKKVASEKGTSINKMEKDLGFARSSISKFNANTPSVEKIQAIADYLNVSVDYLLSGEEQEMDVAAEIQRLINHLTGDNSSYCNGKIMSKEGELALLNSLKQDVEFLNALYKNDNK